ncbi:hypothetical protein HMPREF1978_01437 [Actinomyces graevenitzii F0530]|uniref:Uncharacterized protein n=1 Tax=Actinomyces graevenitzii F0530 TaxID=1321817 RepID=U1PWB5_9ACTO|nr:hypothetical protein HMPREF1978_01437 [Actinomyces graevenitzii F0530]
MHAFARAKAPKQDLRHSPMGRKHRLAPLYAVVADRRRQR